MKTKPEVKEALFCSDCACMVTMQNTKSMGECDNRFSDCCGQIVFYNTVACPEIKTEKEFEAKNELS